MTPEIMCTHGLPIKQQRDAWRAWFSSVFELEEPEDANRGFRAESRYWALNDLGIGLISAPALRATRSRTLVRSNPVDHWCLTIGNHETGISTPNDSLTVPAKTPFLVSLGVVLASERLADERLHLYLPRDSFADIASQLDAAQSTMLEAGLGRLLGHFLRNLALSLPTLAPADLPHVTAAVRAMVGACVVPTADRIALAAGQIDATRLDKVRRIVRRNIDSPALDAGMICGALGVSRSQLYRMLKSEGGVARYIQKLRLEACHAWLSDDSDVRTIAEISERVGFDNPSQFSRAFRREFGASPSEIRIAAMENASIAPAAQHLLGLRPLSRLLTAL